MKIDIKKKILLIFLLSLPIVGYSYDELSVAGLAGAADSAYNSGNYSEAVELYNTLAQENGVSAGLLFNLGNSYYQQGDYGNAMLCYQRAKKLDPSNKKINGNLAFLKGKVEDANKAEQKGKRKKVEEDTPNFFQSIHSAVAEETSSDLWAGWGAAFFLLFAGCVCLYLFNSNVLMRKTGFFGGFILLGLSMICVVCAYMGAAEAENHEYGVIISYKSALQTEPTLQGNSNSNEGILTKGTKIRIISEETDADGNVNWYKIRLNSDYIGWVEAKDVAVI
ncbi:MAG: tetratricopeptide repeat protein [Muribaculaceae bacterium]|nr:tetratricopeptide repeat protein [Muribaculaceae bacterium]